MVVSATNKWGQARRSFQVIIFLGLGPRRLRVSFIISVQVDCYGRVVVGAGGVDAGGVGAATHYIVCTHSGH